MYIIHNVYLSFIVVTVLVLLRETPRHHVSSQTDHIIIYTVNTIVGASTCLYVCTLMQTMAFKYEDKIHAGNLAIYRISLNIGQNIADVKLGEN